jgi:sugar-specific transcriptional regulator TrmB
MEDFLIKQLQELGLRRKEAGLYLALLKIGQGTVSDICKDAKINRTTGHYILIHLYLMGVVSRVVSGKRRFYTAKSPLFLKEYIKARKLKADQDSKMLDEILPELNLLQMGERKDFEMKVLKEGSKTRKVLLENLKQGKISFSLLNFEKVFSELNWELEDYLKKRFKDSLNQRLLLSGCDREVVEKMVFWGHEVKEHCRFCDLSKDLNNLLELSVFDERIVGVFKEMGKIVTFKFENKYLADSFKLIFNVAWNKSRDFKDR